MKISEAAKPAEIISQLMDEDSLVIWGARIDSSMDSTLQVALILTGVKNKQVEEQISKEKKLEEFDEEDWSRIMEELGVKSI
ncbi:MAG: hypothetical protein QXP74_00785 [Nitrososphaerota archaeon]